MPEPVDVVSSGRFSAACAIDEKCAIGRLRTQAGIVERQLLGRIDVGIRTASGRAKQLVDIAAFLVREYAARLRRPRRD
jgi:hypothetical protein